MKYFTYLCGINNKKKIMELELREKLEQIVSKEPSGWHKEAEYRIKNREWLKFSFDIALKLLSFVRENNIPKETLPKLTNISEAKIKRILQGKENLDLKTIAKIENKLNIKLLKF